MDVTRGLLRSCRDDNALASLFRSLGQEPDAPASLDPRYPAEPATRRAASTRAGVNGTSRNRAPVASNTALPITAGTSVIDVSPAPVAGTPAGVTNTVSI